MDAMRGAVRLGVLAAVGLLATLTLWSAVDKPAPEAVHLQRADGVPLPVPALPGVYAATFRGYPVLVFVQPAALLDPRPTDPAPPTASVPHPDDPTLRVFALSAKSTYHGCTVRWTALPEDYDHDGRTPVPGVLHDPCRETRWDPFHAGALIVGPSGMPIPRLPVLDVHVRDGVLQATGYDGDIRSLFDKEHGARAPPWALDPKP